MAIEILRFDRYIGFYDTKMKRRLRNIKPTRKLMTTVKASGFEGGTRQLESTDLHEEVRGKKTLTLTQYKRLIQKYPEYK